MNWGETYAFVSAIFPMGGVIRMARGLDGAALGSDGEVRRGFAVRRIPIAIRITVVRPRP